MHSYNVRISHPYHAIEAWVKQIEGKVLAVEHEADADVSRTHTHILVIDSPVASLALKHKLKRMYPELELTKGDWAFPNMKNDDYQHVAVYYSKGRLDYKHMKNFDFDWEMIKSLWIEPKKVQTQLKYTDPEKMTYKEMIQQIKNTLAEDNDYSTDNILDQIRQVFIIQNKRIIGRFKVRDIVDTLMAEFQPTDWKQSLKRICEYRT